MAGKIEIARKSCGESKSKNECGDCNYWDCGCGGCDDDYLQTVEPTCEMCSYSHCNKIDVEM